MNQERNHEQMQTHLKSLLKKLRTLQAALQEVVDEIPMCVAAGNGAKLPDPTIAGIPWDEFKSKPFVAVSRGKLLDGVKGPDTNRWSLRGAERPVLTHLLLHDSIHALEVVAYQAKNGSGTIFNRKRHAETTIAKLKPAATKLGLEIEKRDGRRSMEWDLLKNDTPVIFSVELAADMTTRAVNEMEKGKPGCALLTAIEALECDDSVQDAHKVLCHAAVQLGSVSDQAAARLTKSVFFLRSRVEQLNRVLQICDNSFAYADHEQVRVDIEFYVKKFTVERERIEAIIADTIQRFGPFDQGAPKDRAANEAIQELRKLSLTFEQAWSHPVFGVVLEHPRVEWMRNRMVTDSRACDQGERYSRRERVNAEVLKGALDPHTVPNIRAICKAVEHAIPTILNPDYALKTREAHDARKLDDAVDSFLKEYSYRPSMNVAEDLNELSRLSGLPVWRLEEAADWKRVQRPTPLEAVEREKQERMRRPSDDSDVDSAYDDAEDNPEDDGEDDGLAGACVC